MNEITVSTWAELIDRLFDESWNPELHRFRSPYVFRGPSDESYQLKSGLIRLGGNYHELKRNLLRNFRKYAHRTVVQQDSIWNWMSFGEHHGPTTRLLDWTYSPLIATQFATCNIEKINTNGAIWCVDFIKTHELLSRKLRILLEDESAHALTVKMLDKANITERVLFLGLDGLSSSLKRYYTPRKKYR